MVVNAVSTVMVMGVYPKENPLKGQEGLEATASNAEVPQEAFGTDSSVQTCEALVASEQLVNRRKPIACPTEWTEHPLLLPWDLELETQMQAACNCDELQTDPVLECTKWRTSGAICQGAGTILSL